MFSKQFLLMLEPCNQEYWWVSPFYHVLHMWAQCQLVHASAEHGHTTVSTLFFFTLLRLCYSFMETCTQSLVIHIPELPRLVWNGIA